MPCFLTDFWRPERIMLVQQTLYKLNHLPTSLSHGLPSLCQPRRTWQSPSLGYTNSSLALVLGFSIQFDLPSMALLLRSPLLRIWEYCLQEPSNLQQILLLLISSNESPHMALVRDPGQESTSKFRPSFCEHLLLYFPPFKAVQFCRLWNRQRTLPQAFSPSFCHTGLLFCWGQNIIFPTIIGIKQKPFERESCM